MTYVAAVAQAIRAQVPEDDLPDTGTDDLFLLYALLAFVKGEQVDDADIHDAWTTWMLLNGQDHQAMVPFADLDAATQKKDAVFARAVRTVAADAQLR